MAVEVELFAQLADKWFRNKTLEIEPDSSVLDVVKHLGVDPGEIGLITIDGVQSTMEDIVPLSCRLCLFPPMSGG